MIIGYLNFLFRFGHQNGTKEHILAHARWNSIMSTFRWLFSCKKLWMQIMLLSFILQTHRLEILLRYMLKWWKGLEKPSWEPILVVLWALFAKKMTLTLPRLVLRILSYARLISCNPLQLGSWWIYYIGCCVVLENFNPNAKYVIRNPVPPPHPCLLIYHL